MSHPELSDPEIARLLPRTWDPFLGRFGRLTQVQREAIPEILGGGDVLVCAPTATGKTEAVCAPLIERHLSRTDPWRIVYVSPTRALVNDLAARLSGPMQQLGVRVTRRTGDHKDSLKGPAMVIITTPESLDSLLCRGRRGADDHVLFGVDAVVLDEVHLLFGSPRGEQVRWLLERLRRVIAQAARQGATGSDSLQVVALSATVQEPSDIASTFLRSAVTVTVGGGRTIEAVSPDVQIPAPELALPAYLRGTARGEKVLVFSNARRRVDQLSSALATTLAPLGYHVHAHHGSLSQAVREETETAARDYDKVVVCATSTLEIGIDIGDIDLVVLDGPAPDLPGLLQRVGRGNRRTSQTRVMACAGSLGESIVHAAMIDAVRSGWLGPSQRGPQYAVAVQQIASYIFQSPMGSRSLPAVEDFVRCVIPELDAGALARHLVDQGDLALRGGRISLGEQWLEATLRGEIHSTIEARVGVAVEDDTTGMKLAHGVRGHTGRGMQMAGRLLEVSGWDDFRIRVRSADRPENAAGEWSYVSSRWLFGPGQPQSIRRFLGLAETDWPVLVHSSSLQAFHFGGGRRKAVLRLAMQTDRVGPFPVDEWTLTLPQGRAVKPRRLTGVRATALASQLTDLGKLGQLERDLARPQANSRLPVDVRQAEIRGWLNLDAEVEAINASRFVEVADEDVSRALEALLDRRP